jgi:uncharacterized protein
VELSNKNLTLAAILGVGVLLLISLSFLPMKSETLLPTTTLTIGDTSLVVELAVSSEDRARGLSGRTGLAEGTGMLFVFEGEGNWGIWMKDMRFPIDILWANANGIIVTIERNVSPATYPNSFYPSSPAAYVLEVPAGFAERHGIVTGAQLVVQ